MGFNSGIIAGALLYLKVHFEDIANSTFLFGMVTSVVFISAFLANSCVAALIDRFGRVIILYLMNIPFVLGAVISACAPSTNVLLAGRLLTGFAVGIAGTLPNLYIAEIAHPESRGRAVGKAPLYGTTGIMASQFCSWIIAEVLGYDLCCEYGWRIMFGMGAIPAIIQFFWVLGIPESPRWCLQRGLFTMAKENQAYLESVEGGSPPLVDGDGGASTVQSGAETTEKVGVGNAAIAIGLSIMQQLSGVNAVIYYAPHLYTQLGVKANIAILIAGLNSVAQVGMTKIMTLVIDSLGRRTICLVGLLGMFFGLTSLAVVFQSSTIVGEQAVAMAVGGILIFRLSFSLSLGPLPYIMVTELFPQRQRARGAALSMMTNWILNWFVVFMIPEAMSRYKGGVFFAFAVVCVISAVAVDLWLP